ncbi:hypothetical protein GCAAIG_05270 [Candidatus Electronema halotolerans]
MLLSSISLRYLMLIEHLLFSLKAQLTMNHIKTNGPFVKHNFCKTAKVLPWGDESDAGTPKQLLQKNKRAGIDFSDSEPVQ